MKVSEVAEHSGVSVQAVRQYCRTHFDESKKGRSGWNLTPEDAQRIIDHYKSENSSAKPTGKESAKGNERKDDEAFVTVPRDVLDELRGQLKIKDNQIADLSASLKAAHESLHAAQALHGADVLPKAIEVGGDGADGSEIEKETATVPEIEHPTRWQYFKAVFTGVVE